MTDARMTAQEAVLLCRMAKAACPQQQFDQYTPDMWHELLGDLRFDDARMALVQVVKKQPFIAPAEIRDEVKRIRSKRLLDYGYVTPPAELADNPAAEQAWLYTTLQAIADGDIGPGDLPERPQELLTRIMPDWDRVLSRPINATGVQLIAESRRSKDPHFRERMEEARAQLGPAAPMPADPTREEETS